MFDFVCKHATTLLSSIILSALIAYPVYYAFDSWKVSPPVLGTPPITKSLPNFNGDVNVVVESPPQTAMII